ncbi:sigma-70 family RNA polymerase sigma factor [Aquincola sp. S2]|uniref:Sigma-70 family RNA polymerase sigma factor n=2 Tax=Pseudaquabacterium terrae TaxID=2732868 RepID=A0ABX2EJQ1_9BURK|nr:sigma-70 family RNA polymerase sigma factor [Aquabacterium terrae]
MPPPGGVTVDPRQARDRQLAGWLQQAAQGDAQAFESFYDATIVFAHAFARRLLREADVDDVIADAYFQAWREAPRFDAARGSAATWLLTRVHSRAIDLRRQQRHDSAAPAPDSEDDPLARQASDLPGPEDLLALAEAGSRLYRALAALSPQERWVLGLAYFRELSHAATAQATGLPLGTVKSLLLRAQQKLRALMGVGGVEGVGGVGTETTGHR